MQVFFMEKIDKTLTKYNKLKLFGEHVSAHMREVVDVEGLRRIDVDVARTDCLYNGDIYTTRDLYEKLDAIAACASILELRQYDTGEIKIHNANYCHNPVVCPICSDRVSKRRRALFTEPLKRAVRKFGVQRATGDWKSEYPDAYTGVYMATATIKDGNNLKERIDTLLDAVKRMRKMGQKRQGGRSQGEWSKVRAGLSNVEIKIGTGSGKWHVHAHFLLFTDSPINIRTTDSEYFIKKETEDLNLFEDKVQISKFNHEWYTATHGQGINFDVRPIEFKRDVNGRKCETFAESVDAQAQEVLKYSTLLSTKKGTGVLSSAQYVELIQRRGTRRLFNAIGLLRCDKRNPDSFMTITERELRRLEYVDQMDSKYYEIYASQWQHGESYGKTFKQDRAVFSTSDDMKTKFVNIRRRSFMAQTAIYQGEYRKQRNNFFKSRHMYSDKNVFEGILNDCRDIFRNKVAALWQKLSDNDFIPDFLTEWDSTGLPGFKQKHLRFAS
jgi:hypothetical protein